MATNRLAFALAPLCALLGCNVQNAATVAPTFDVDSGMLIDPNNPGGTQGGTGAPGGLPCAVQAILAAQCQSCHSSPPSSNAPMALIGWSDLAAPSKTQPQKSNAQLSVERMQSGGAPMPPSPPRASAGDIATIEAWVTAGLPKGDCSAPDGGVPNPYNTPVQCTSGQQWSGGGEGSRSMDPGQACIQCHSSSFGEAPNFEIAGTAYATAHEPDDCYGGNAGAQAQVVITDANGRVYPLSVNGAGNFYYSGRNGSVALPYRAKVTVGGKVRAMSAAQSNGDCNSCHTVSGTQNAPGRIMLP